jgi:outer membrane protein
MSGNALRLLTLLLALTLAGTCSGESLTDAWNVVLTSDLRAKARQNMSEAARLHLAAARGRRLPTLSLEAAYTRLDTTPAISLSLPQLGTMELPIAEDSFAFSRATVTLPLYTHGKITSGIAAASALLEAAGQDQRGTDQEIKLELAESYVAVLRAEHEVAVARKSLESLTAHLHDVDNVYRQGLAAKNDLLASSVARSEARQQLLQTQNRLDMARSAYNRLMGRELTEPVTLDDIAPAAGSQGYDALVQSALKNRAELASLEQHAGALRHQASGVAAANGPQVALSGGYSYLENRQLVRDQFWSVSLGLKWNLFDSGVTRREASALTYQAEAVANQVGDLRSRLVLQIRQAWLAAEESRQRIAVAQEALAQSQENLEVAKDRYRNAVGTSTEVLDAEALSSRSHANYDNAVYDSVLAQLRLKRAAGEL